MVVSLVMTVVPRANGQTIATPGSSPDAPFVLHADSLRNAVVPLPNRWRFHAGHDAALADPAVDDSAWPLVDSRLPASGVPEAWDGHGLFRLHVVVDSSLHHRPLGLLVRHFGASEVYVDGELVTRVGRLASGSDPIETRVEPQPRPLSLAAGAHVLAIRYAQPPSRAAQQSFGAGFTVRIVEPERYTRQLLVHTRRSSGTQFFFVALFCAFALIHLVLFAFHRQAREHLWFGLLALVTAGLSFGMMQFSFVESAAGAVNRLRGMTVLTPLLGLVLLRFTYVLFYDRLPRQFYLFLAAGVAVIAWALVVPADFFYLFAFVIVACLEVVRATILALMRRKPGAGVLGFGLSVLALATMTSLLQEVGVLPLAGLADVFNLITGATVLLVAMSVHLSRQVARTNVDLAAQLQEVRRLSEEQLLQERRAREAEIQHERVEAENRRRARELNEARQLQLSMLPDSLPEVPGLEIDAFMSTATEVGGDYYDFSVSPSGTLTVAVGDATGHGMRAGTVVTAAKSLLSTLEDDEALDGFLSRASRSLRSLQLPGLYMGLVLARWDGRSLRVSSAGMPHVHIWRGSTQQLETISLKALPLGGPAFPYAEAAVDLHPGDVVLFMTDGLPERFNLRREEFGYEEAARAFTRSTAENGHPRHVIEQLVAEAEEWAEGAPPDDDITFVVLRVR